MDNSIASGRALWLKPLDNSVGQELVFLLKRRPERTIFVFGNSHTKALSDALQDGFSAEDNVFDINWIKADRGAALKHGTMRLSEALGRVASLGENDLVGVILAGMVHHALGLLETEPLFTTSGIMRENAQSIPQRLLEDWIREQGGSLKKIRKLKRIAPCPVVHLPVPPPKADNDFIRTHSAIFRKPGNADKKLAPPELRKTLWEIEMKVLREELAAIDVILMNPPEDTITNAGYLRPDCYHEDGAHANSEYGAQVLRMLSYLP